MSVKNPHPQAAAFKFALIEGLDRHPKGAGLELCRR